MRLLALAVLGVFAVGSACQSDPRPWKVKPGYERRFGEARKACEALTDDDEAFESCMQRRGWRREYPGGF